MAEKEKPQKGKGKGKGDNAGAKPAAKSPAKRDGNTPDKGKAASETSRPAKAQDAQKQPGKHSSGREAASTSGAASRTAASKGDIDRLVEDVIQPDAPAGAAPADGDAAADGDASEGKAPPAGEKREQLMVAIGASAGGLEALKEVIAKLKPTGMISYVVAQHLSPTHTSLLTELLTPGTELEVRSLEARTIPKPDVIYVAPPNHDVVYQEGRMMLPEPMARIGPKPSLDRLFKSLAENYGENCVAIVLSGTGTDGAAGIRAVKAAGGIILVQNPLSAKYDGMPKAAEQTGCVDLVLEPDKIAEALTAIVTATGAERLPSPERSSGEDVTSQIISLVRSKSGFDLNHYKQSTLHRRIRRRMALHGAQAMEDYVELLREGPEEAVALARDILISVTSFFRDPDAFNALQPVIDEMVAGRGANDVLRIWVPACATGEEAYSLAILLAESMRDRANTPDFIIFASDIDQPAVEHARNGVYGESSVEHLPKKYRERYLERHGQRYVVRKSLRQNMVFAMQNVVDDPPFSRIDLVACRNLLIYFTQPVQKRVQEIFHYALKPNGYLFLGKTETADQNGLFEPVSKLERIYRRLEKSQPYAGQLMYRPRARGGDLSAKPIPRRNDAPSLAVRLRDTLLDAYCPASVMLDEKDVVVNFTGDLRPFLRFPRGSAELYLFDMVDERLRPEVRALAHRTRRENRRCEGGLRKVKIDGEDIHVRVITVPLDHDQQRYLVLSFHVVDNVSESVVAEAPTDEPRASIVAELEKELATTREQLQTVVEELETSNEELQSQSEELQSSNEEMQSTNEELQTANEELQSTNEELLTVNDELEQKSSELEKLAEDLDNIKESIDYPLIVLDEHLRVSQANAAASELLKLDGLALEAPIASIDADVDLLSFLPNIRNVFKSGVPDETAITDHRGRTFTLRVMPYRSSEQKTVGALVSFFDVTNQRRSEAALRESEALYRVTFEHGGVGMALLDSRRRITRVNKALSELLGTEEAKLLKTSLDRLFEDGDRERWLSALSLMTRDASIIHRDEYRLVDFQGDPVWVLMNVTVARNQVGDPERYICQIENIHNEKEREQSLQHERRELTLLNRISNALVGEDSSQAVIEITLDNLAETIPGVIAMHATITDDGEVCLLERSAEDAAMLDESTNRRFMLDPAQPLVVRLRGGRPAVAADVSSSTLFREVRGYFVEAEVAAALITPMQHEGDEMGLLCLFSKTPRDWTEHEVSITGAVAHLLDVGLRTSRLREERAVAVQALSDEKERIQTTLRSVGDGVITTSLDQRITYMNPSAENLIVCRLEDAIGRPLDEFFSLYMDQGSQAIESPVIRCLRENRVVEQTEYGVALTNRGGRKIGIDSSAAPLTNHAGETVGAVLVFRDVTDQQLLADELSYRASHDLLTGLVNRDEFERILNRELSQGNRQSGSTDALLYIDLDRFKIVNDSSGHTAGDELLRQVSTVIRDKLRKADLLARLGGDEFGVLLRNCSQEWAEKLAGEIILAVESHRFEWDDRSYEVGASIGLAMIDEHAENVSKVLAQADAACYSAKDAGRNRFHVSGSEEEQTSGRYSEMQLVADISDAITEERFKFVAQPVLDIRGDARETVYEELLVRFIGEDGQIISPGEFIPAAERYYLMNTVDRATTRRALSQLAQVLAGNESVYAINLSGQTLSDTKFVGFVRDLLLEHEVDPKRVCFEITETAAVSQLTVAVRFMNQLRDMGCKFALDDFGAGMSSFTYLKNMPIDYLKIDGSFVRNILENNVDKAVVESAVRIGGELGIITIAEHLEDEETLDLLREMGVDLVQGFYTGKPAPFPP